MADLDAFYRVYLKSELAERKRRNRLYSMRSYALALGVDNGFLSRLLSGKTLLSLDVADKLAKRLRLDPPARVEFLRSAADEQACHALYLIDPSATDCDPCEDEMNRSPAPRKSRSRASAVPAHST